MRVWTRIGKGGVIFISGLALVLGFSGCGKKGNPIPRDARVPRAVKNLQLKKLPGAVQLTWGEPRKDLHGDKLKGLAGYNVLRKIIKPGSNECVDCPGGFSVVAVLDRDHPVHFKVEDHTVVWIDRDLKKPGIYVYRIVPFNVNGYQGEISGYVKTEIPGHE